MENETIKKIMIALIIISVLESLAICALIKRNIKMYQYLDTRVSALEISVFPGFYR